MGHSSDPEAATGCTVILGPFRASVDVRGLASSTRQLDPLNPNHITPQVDAILLTGGSAYGLAAADGVAAWLEEEGRGLDTGVSRVAIVPTAVIFDLGVGRADRRPDAGMGRAACESATADPVPEGRVGVGTGATVGKLLGPDGAMPGGLGSWIEGCGDAAVGALAVVNAYGDVLDENGEVVAGARDSDGRFLDTRAYLRQADPPERYAPRAGGNTTLAVVATDRALTRTALHSVARQAMNGIVRRTSPANTQYDGDIVFAVSTALSDPAPDSLSPAATLRIGLCAEWALERAIERAVSGV